MRASKFFTFFLFTLVSGLAALTCSLLLKEGSYQILYASIIIIVSIVGIILETIKASTRM